MSFLPQGYENLQPVKKYWKMSDMKEGDTKIRIVMPPIAGWIYWLDKKPVRSRPEDKPAPTGDDKNPVKGFWCLYVWDYEREDLFILEITQSSILKSLVSFGEDQDWGDFTNYDIKITKSGALMKTKYLITALPHKEISQKVKDAMHRSPVRLSALYDGLDPWMDLEETHVALEKVNPVVITSTSVPYTMEDKREEMLIAVQREGLSADRLEQFLEKSASNGKVKRTVNEVIDSAFLPNMMPKFLEAYQKFCESVAA